MVIRLKRSAVCLQMVQLMSRHPKTPSFLASFKSRLVLPFWCRLTQDVLEKKPLNWCSSSSSSSSSSSRYCGRKYTPCSNEKLEEKYTLESTDPRESEIRAHLRP